MNFEKKVTPTATFIRAKFYCSFDKCRSKFKSLRPEEESHTIKYCCNTELCNTRDVYEKLVSDPWVDPFPLPFPYFKGEREEASKAED